jgi:probable rRNA maturation factor
MLNVLFRTDSHYTVNRKRVRNAIEAILAERKVKGDMEVSVIVVGDRMMKSLNKKYRKLDKTTDVLSFPLHDGAMVNSTPFVDPPDGFLRLGDIVVSYPQAVYYASEENKFVDDKIDELVQHATLHLLGIHHEE